MVSKNSLAEKNTYSAPHELTSVAVFMLAAIALVVPSGYSLGAIALLLAGVGLLIRRGLPSLTTHDRLIIATLAGYSLVGIAEAWWDSQGSSGLDKPIRYLLAVPALWWVLAYPPRLAFLWSGIAIGAISAGGWAAWQKLFTGIARAEGHTHVIQFGNLSMLLGVLCMAGLGWAVVQRQRNIWVALLLVGAAGGVLGSLFSGSRGGWVGFPVVLLVLYRAYGAGLSGKLKAAAIVTVVAAGIVIYAVPQLGVQSRVNHAVSDVALYISGENRATSVGSRFEMWRGAALLVQEKPLTGWGSNGYAEAMSQLGDEGIIHQEAARYDHPHNEFMDASAKRGLIGLIALLALYLIPMRLFAQKLQDEDLSVRALATAGVLLPVTYIDFGLSQAFLTHNSGVMMYAFLLVTFWGVYANQGQSVVDVTSKSNL
jgi:O-antigen ligase